MIKEFVKRLFPSTWVGHMYPVSWVGNDMSGTTVPTVSPFQALRFTPVYRAVTLIASDIARIESSISDSSCDS